jgi:predicted ATPase/class 3 adenylate cyclase
LTSQLVRDLPAGTVTFLFTDVEGSTRLLRDLGAEQYADALAEHRRCLRTAFERHGGVEVDTQGDAFFVAFPRATDAVAAAADGNRKLEEGPIRVRIGIHTGEPLVSDEGYVGIDVHRAARIAAAGHGGQVLVSETTRRLLGDEDGVRDLGEHRLKDMTHAERLYQLGGGDFPALRTLDATNLPLTWSGLVGRQAELAELAGLLSNGARLLTITGPGGTGKTRLALQVAAELVGTVSGGVFWIPLAGLADPELVPSEIAQVVGAPDDLGGFLRGRELVLLLDNFEHLVDAAPSVGALLAGSPGLRVLVTSRAPLRLSGEREYRLEPLPAADATELFVERARAAGRELVPDATVEAICLRLDGLPLAVELAAARTKLLAPERLLERLDSALPLLTGGTRDAPERQRTLRATLEWSYDLLDQPLRELHARLGVFAGGVSLEAAEAVCGAELDTLAALVDSSLLRPIGDDRLLMLETVREYALERLETLQAVDEVCRRHAEFFALLAEDAYRGRVEAEEEWSRRLDEEQDNLRAALDWLADRDADASLRVAGALGWFWLSRALVGEGRSRLETTLAGSAAGGAARARALAAAGALAGRGGDAELGRELLEQGVALWRELGERAEEAATLIALGWFLVYDAQDEEASLCAFEESSALFRDLGDSTGETLALVGAGQALVALGEVERAEALSHDLLERAGGDVRIEHFAQHFLADCALLRGDVADAGVRYRVSVEAALRLGDVIETSVEVQGVAMAAAGAGDARLALLLAASVEALWESLGISLSVEFWDRLLERYIGDARRALGPEAELVWAEGRTLTFDDAVELARAPASA